MKYQSLPMDARLRETFLSELMITAPTPTPATAPPLPSTTTTELNRKLSQVTCDNQEEGCKENRSNNTGDIERGQVNITLLGDSGSTGRTLSGLFVACDTNLTHILINDLKTPICTQSSALLRLNDVIAITYR